MRTTRDDTEALYCIECSWVLPREFTGKVLSDHECLVGPSMEAEIQDKAWYFGFECPITIGVCNICLRR